LQNPTIGTASKFVLTILNIFGKLNRAATGFLRAIGGRVFWLRCPVSKRDQKRMADAMKSFVAAQNIVNFKVQLQGETHLDNEVRPTSGRIAMRTMLRSLLGEIHFERLCPGIKVGTIDEDVLEVFVPAENRAAEIKFRHSDDFAVAAEYALGRPIRKVNVLSAD
jgi:hypothetical protein